MSSQPLVSILIPCYNAEEWIADALESALGQTWPHCEIIVVDDGSRDRSLAIARRHEPRGVKVIAQPNAGASAARNRAFEEAQGDFIQYLDADDLLAPDKIERQMKALRAATEDTLASGEWWRFRETPADAYAAPDALWSDLEPVAFLTTAWGGPHMMQPSAWLTPRRVAERAGPWNEELSLDDDGEYFARVVLASSGVKFVAGAKIFYRSGLAGNLAGRRGAKALASAFRSVELGTAALLAREDSPRTRRASATRFQGLVYELFPQAGDLVRRAEARVAELGGSDLPPHGGPLFQRLSGLIGWRGAKRIQRLTHALGYRKLGARWLHWRRRRGPSSTASNGEERSLADDASTRQPSED